MKIENKRMLVVIVVTIALSIAAFVVIGTISDDWNLGLFSGIAIVLASVVGYLLWWLKNDLKTLEKEVI